MDENIAQFTAITSADPARAEQYLSLTDGNLEQAVQLFFDSGGVDMAATAAPSGNHGAATTSSHTQNPSGVVTIDSDDDDDRPGTSHMAQNANFESDEAMARRLQEQAYGPSGDPDQVRAPMSRTTETLVGPGADYGDSEIDMRAAIAEQLQARQGRGTSRPGIFNQRPSVWDESASDSDANRLNLARATGGASEASSKSSLLAELFRPPSDLISPLSWDEARTTGRDEERWIMVNVQDPSIFDCQVLNRDIWKNSSIRDTIKQHFIFMQFTKDDPRSGQYVNYYFQNRDIDDAYPHIAIVDPRTGEQVKVWSGPPVPKAADFIMELHEFLDRYSLSATARNPVAKTKPAAPRKDVAQMSEDEMLEMALQASLSNGKTSTHQAIDPDALTRDKGKAIEDVEMGATPAESSADVDSGVPTAFSAIPSDRAHEEPSDPATSTRIQFRWSAGRIVRRFTLTDPVQRLYEWLKASPLEGKSAESFELIAMGKNLIESLDQTIEQAGLKNGTIMVEHIGA